MSYTWEELSKPKEPELPEEEKVPFMQKVNYIGIIAGVLLIISVFLPVVTTDFKDVITIKLISYRAGTYLIIAAVAGIVGSVMDKNKITLCAGIVAAVVAIRTVSSYKSGLAPSLASYVHYETGAILAVVSGVLLLLAVPIMNMIKKSRI